MKNITLAIALFISVLNFGQTSEVTEMASKIIGILDGTEAFKEYSNHREIIKQQLNDIHVWTEEGKISLETYQSLRTSYTNYSGKMNSVKEELHANLSDLYENRKVKKSRLKKLFNNLSGSHATTIQAANEIYLNEWTPAMEIAIRESDSKGGIIVSIVAIFKIGETIFHAIKDLFKTGSLNKAAEEQLMIAALKLTKKQLDKKLSLPDWEEVIPYYYPSSSAAVPQNTRSYSGASSYRSSQIETNESKNSIALAVFGSDMPITLRRASKGIRIGSAENLNNLPIYSTFQEMQNGDRFWVKLTGNLYANFFYYDQQDLNWNDPYGKSIIVGSETASRNSATYLPASDQFFEIVGDSETEEFLIILTNFRLNQKQRSQIMRNNSTRDQLLTSLPDSLSDTEVKFTTDLGSSEGNNLLASIFVDTPSDGKIAYPIYIILEKTTVTP